MKPINKRLLIMGVAIGIFLCTLIVGIVQVRFLINKILDEREEKPFKYYQIYEQAGEGFAIMKMRVVKPLLDAMPKDMEVTFEATYLPLLEVLYHEESISSTIQLTDESNLKLNDFTIIKGRYFNEQDNLNKEKVCVIHEDMYQMLGKGDNITLNINGEDFRVIGVVSGEPAEISSLKRNNIPLDEVIFMPINTYHEYFMHIEPEHLGTIEHIIIKAPKSYTK